MSNKKNDGQPRGVQHTILGEGARVRKHLFAGLCLFLAAAAGSSEAQLQTKEASPTISMDVTEAYLEDVLKVLSKQSGMNFVASEAVQEKKVTLYFDRVSVSDALESILKANHLSLQTHGGKKNLFMVTESGAPRFSTVTKVFQLKYARVLPSAGESTKSFGLGGSLIKETFGGSGSSSSSGGGSTSTGSSSGSNVGGGTGSEQTGGPLKIIQALLSEHGSVVPDPRTNSLIVTEIPERMEVIEQTIAKLDIKPKQIYIEAEVLEVTVDTLRRIGLEYGSSTGTLASYVGPKRTSFFPFSLGLLDGATQTHTLGTLSLAEVNILLKMLATEKDVKFLARPRLLTLSNEVAEIRIVTEAVTGTVSDSQATTGTVTTSAERTTVGTILRVTPMVNDGKFITMVIEPEVSRVITSNFNSSFQDPNRRVARTTVMVPDGATAMIAGLISSEYTDESRKIPGLGDLPLVGLPFKRTTAEKENTEILLFITPHILEEDEANTKARFAKEREQAPLSSQEERALSGHRKRILKERSIVETIDHIAW